MDPSTAPAGTPTPIHRNTKRAGELSEAAFLLKAETLGLHCTKPWGDSDRYDFILDNHRRLWRVQVKSTEVVRARGYDVQPTYSIYGKGKIAYTADDIDILAVHIPPLDTWYIIPVEAFTPRRSLRLYPNIPCKCARWENYHQAWHIVQVAVCSVGAPPAAFDQGPCGADTPVRRR